MRERSATRLPPIWLSASALTGLIAVIFGIQRWIDHFTSAPESQDLRLELVAARVGLKYGWSHIYDVDLEASVAAGLTGPGRAIDSMHLFVNPPPTAWMLAPLAWQPPAASFLVWTLVSLAAFVAAAWLIVPGKPFARATVVLVSLALYPVHFEFWQGQTVVAVLALVALSYWLLERDRWIWCGVVLALAFCFKPQDALLVPAALLVSGRWRPVAVSALTGCVIAAVCALSLGPHGIESWSSSLAISRAEPSNTAMTYAFLLGRGPLTTAIEVGLGLCALAVAWARKDQLALVFSLGLVGTMMSASYLHEQDITMLVLAAWIILRAQPSLQMKLWLLLGIVAAQFISIGMPIPMLLWEPGLLLLLALEQRFETTPSLALGRFFLHAEDAQEKAREDRLHA